MIKSYCNKCGNELLPGASFCMKCGSKITTREPLSSTSSDNEDCQNEDEIIADKMYERDSYDRSNTDTGYDDIYENRVIHREIDDNVPKNESKYAGDNAIVAWFLNLDFFCKISGILIALFTVIGIISAFTDYTLVTVISFIQVAGAVWALLMHKDIIKIDSRYGFVKYLILLVTVLLLMVSIKSCSSKNDDDIDCYDNGTANVQHEKSTDNKEVSADTSSQTVSTVPTNTPTPTCAIRHVHTIYLRGGIYFCEKQTINSTSD